MKAEIKEQTPQLTLLYCVRTVRSSQGRFSIKKAVQKFSEYPQETLLLESLLKMLQISRPATLLKREPNTGVFL